MKTPLDKSLSLENKTLAVQPPLEFGLHRRNGVALVGPTGAGKSTLFNQLVGEKVSIVSHRPQTTYHLIAGSWVSASPPPMRIHLWDTPGFHVAKHPLKSVLLRNTHQALSECQLVAWVFSVTEVERQFQTRTYASKMQELFDSGKPQVLLLSKQDLYPKERLLPLLRQLGCSPFFKDLIPLSGRTGENTDRFLEVLLGYGVGEPVLCDSAPTPKTDLPLDFRVREILREKLYKHLEQEVAYSVLPRVTVIPREDRTTPSTLVRATLSVERDSQKGILIGKRGALLKRIGTESRLEMEKLLQTQVYLDLHVTVFKNWRRNKEILRRWVNTYT